MTSRALNSHDVAAPVSPQNQVNCLLCLNLKLIQEVCDFKNVSNLYYIISVYKSESLYNTFYNFFFFLRKYPVT